jgi:hypothetical protein
MILTTLSTGCDVCHGLVLGILLLGRPFGYFIDRNRSRVEGNKRTDRRLGALSAIAPLPRRSSAQLVEDLPGSLRDRSALQVKDHDAFAPARLLARELGMPGGVSCGAAALAAIQVARQPENADKLIAVALPDPGERYLSARLFPE